MKRICVFGMGGIGGYIGAKLGSALCLATPSAAIPVGSGIELVFIARGAHLDAIRKNGLRYRAPDGLESLVVPSLATDDPSSVGKVDLVFLCVKGYDLGAACGSIGPMLRKDTAIVPLLNGIDIAERIRSVTTEGIVLPSCIYISSSIKESGLIAHSGGKGNLVVGRGRGEAPFDPAWLLDLLSSAGIPCEWYDDPYPALWAKYLFIASFALVTGLSGKSFGPVLEDTGLSSLMGELLEEIASLARAKGIALPASAASEVLAKGRAFPVDTRTSYQRDIEAGREQNEGELFGDTVIRLGKELGVPTPATERVYGAILSKAYAGGAR